MSFLHIKSSFPENPSPKYKKTIPFFSLFTTTSEQIKHMPMKKRSFIMDQQELRNRVRLLKAI